MSLRTETRTRVGYVFRYPTDLAVVSLCAIVAYLLVTSYPAGSALRLAGAIPLVVFLPGYALVAVLFPARARGPRSAPRTTAGARPGGIDTVERIGLALPVSIALVVAATIVLAMTGWGLVTEPVAAALAGISVVLAQLGVIRRFRVPKTDRYTVSARAAASRVYRTPENGINASAVVLTIAVAAAVGALLLGFLAPLSAGGFTELAIYTEAENGDLVADGFPSEIEPGESVPVMISLENREGEPTNYTLVVQQQVIEDGEVVERTELRTIDARLNGTGPATAERTVTPTAGVDETVRISFLLYYDEPPANPTNENAAEDVYFWVTATENPGEDEEAPEGDEEASDEFADNDSADADNESAELPDNDSADLPDNESDGFPDNDSADADNDSADDISEDDEDDSFSLEDIFGGNDSDD